jgi:predicted GNAT family N-acyltransferase
MTLVHGVIHESTALGIAWRWLPFVGLSTAELYDVLRLRVSALYDDAGIPHCDMRRPAP